MYFKLEPNKEYEILILLEDKYDINWTYYHKDETSNKKIKCWSHIHTDCYFCEKYHKNPSFISLLPVYIRERQETSLIFLNKFELDKLLALFQNLVSSGTINKDLKDMKEHFFSIKKTYRTTEFKYLRKHSYKKMNIKQDINIREYINRNYMSYDSYWLWERFFAIKKAKMNDYFELDT